MKGNTLQITKPVGKTLAASLLLLALALPALELLARLPITISLLPSPSIGSAHKKLDLNFSFLDRLVNEEGPVDCLFIGSSMVKASIDPEIISRVYKQESGQTIRCFNFGVAGFTPRVAANLAEILIEKYKPRVLIWGISPESFIQGAGRKAKEMLELNAWYRYQKGEFNLPGWLTEYSQAFRYFLRGKIWLENPMLSRELSLRERGMSRYGFSRKNREKEPAGIALKVQKNNKAFPKDKKLYVSNDAFFSLKKLLAFKSRVQLILVEIPVHPSITGVYKKTPDLRGKIRENIAKIAAEEKIPFIQSHHLEPIPDKGWKNINHMNVRGADIFSEWLGIQLAKEKL